MSQSPIKLGIMALVLVGCSSPSKGTDNGAGGSRDAGIGGNTPGSGGTFGTGGVAGSGEAYTSTGGMPGRGSRDAGTRIDTLPASGVSTFLAEYVGRYCEFSVRCGGHPDQPTCERYMLYNKRYAQGALNIDYSVSIGRTILHQEDEASCLDAISSMSCSRTSAGQVGIDDRCKPVFQGTVADGAECVINTECLSGSCSAAPCPTDGTCCRNRCTSSAPAPLPTMGSACDWSCVAGAYCDRSSVPSICRARLAVGQACTSSDYCEAGLACVPNNDPRTCMAYVLNGHTCSANGAMCDDPQSYCDTVSGICVALGRPGSACVNSSQCLPYATCVSGTCQMRPQEGEACVPDAGIEARCLVGTCFQGRCTVGPEPQQPCTLSVDGGA